MADQDEIMRLRVELGVVKDRANQLKETIARLCESKIAFHLQQPENRKPHFCEDFGCEDFKRLAAEIRSLSR